MYNKQRVTRAVIPAAGMGTRMLPLAAAIPKELLPVGKLPMIHYAVREAIAAGVKECCIIINKAEKRAIETYFESQNPKQEHELTGAAARQTCEFIFIDQPEPVGMGDAIMRSKQYVGAAPFFLLMPDNVFPDDFSVCQRLQEAHREYGQCILGLVEVTKETAPFFSNSGRVRLEPIEKHLYRIKKLLDKTKGIFETGKQERALRACGRALLTSEFFEIADRYDPEKLSVQDEVPILQEIARQDKLLGLKLRGKLFDCGNWPGYWAANRYWMQRKQLWS